jgi:hypothetical protein
MMFLNGSNIFKPDDIQEAERRATVKLLRNGAAHQCKEISAGADYPLI